MANEFNAGGLLERISYANSLFKEGVTRRELAILKPAWGCRDVKVRFHRNHSFEHVVAVSAAWAGYAKMSIKWQEAPYDDALTMNVSGEEPDLDIIWYDVESIQTRLGHEMLEWLKGRIKVLRASTTAPVLVVLVGLGVEQERELTEASKSLPGVRIAPVCDVLSSLRTPFDSRLAKISGARLSEEANLALAKHLACRWLPAILTPRIKAVAVDLDQTIYSGVLGEDGVSVTMTPAHASLQASLRGLKESGIFLAVVSKNEPADVDMLFAKRPDFPLRLGDFSANEIGWGSKSESIAKACQKLRIDPSAVLFIDDNPGELAEVSGRFPGIELIHAGADVCRTVRELEFYPGLWSWGVSSDDILRVADLGAEATRKRIRDSSSDQIAYLRELAPEVDLWMNSESLVGRLAELSKKTNQFNLSLRRLDEFKVNEYVKDAGRFAIGIGLRDRLTDSGIIAAMFGRIDDDKVIVDEWVISCRALGRGLEGLMASSALGAAAGSRKTALFSYRSGPRNNPAREWLAKISGDTMQAEGSHQVNLPLLSGIADMPVRINIHGNERQKHL